LAAFAFVFTQRRLDRLIGGRLRQADVVLELQLDAKVVVEASDTLEVSMDCSHCVRTGRTVIFTVGSASGACTADLARRHQAHPPYPGRIVERVIERGQDGITRVIYRLEYDAHRFDDAKYGPETRPWSGHPTWGRVSFTLVCPLCSKVLRTSAQNNLGRPFAKTCGCGYQFYIERREMPRLRWRDPDLDKWYDVPARFDAPENEWGKASRRLLAWFGIQR